MGWRNEKSNFCSFDNFSTHSTFENWIEISIHSISSHIKLFCLLFIRVEVVSIYTIFSLLVLPCWARLWRDWNLCAQLKWNSNPNSKVSPANMSTKQNERLRVQNWIITNNRHVKKRKKKQILQRIHTECLECLNISSFVIDRSYALQISKMRKKTFFFRQTHKPQTNPFWVGTWAN